MMMRLGFAGIVALAFAATQVVSLADQQQPAPGQKRAAAAAPAKKTPGKFRTPWGDPDLQGLWSNATTTPLERPNDLAGKAELTDEEHLDRQQRVSEARNTDKAPAAGDPGTYNEIWWERGKLLKTTSIIIDPPDGKVPPLTPQAQQQADQRAAARKGHEWDSVQDRNLHERCLLYHGVPPLPTGYNNNYHIAQTPDHVAILSEMIHEVRLIAVKPRPYDRPAIRQWMGDSRGRWEGDTLVVETTNFNSYAGGLWALNRNYLEGTGESLKVIERFRRVDEDSIDYTFTIDDPKTFTRPWTGSLPMEKIEGPIFEYACHEGNYAMTSILAGARAQEKKAAEEAAKKKQ
jgi:hypothetical protein